MQWELINRVALGLLLLRVVSVTFMVLVLTRQARLFKDPVDEKAAKVRLVLFLMAVVIMLGQFVPITIDVATLIADVSRTTPNNLGIAYGLSNAITDAIQSILFWLIYRFIAQQNLRLVEQAKENQDLHEENDRLQ